MEQVIKMTFKIYVESEEPIYRQLVRQTIVGIARGQLKPGDALAPVRQLAVDLGINLHTVAKAYGILKQEGYLTNNRQKGMAVSAEMPPADPAFRARAVDALLEPMAEAVCRGLGREECLALCAQTFDELAKGEYK